MNKNYYKILKYIEDNETTERVVNINSILRELYPESCENQSQYIKSDLERLKEYNYIHKFPDFISSLDCVDAEVKRKLGDKEVKVELTEVGRNVLLQHETNILTKKNVDSQNKFNMWLIIFTAITVFFAALTALKECLEIHKLLQGKQNYNKQVQIHKPNVQLGKKTLETNSYKQ